MGEDTSEASRSFLKWLGAVMAPVLLALAATAVYIEPPTGVLTMLGGYAERDFGWNSMQVAADPGRTREHARYQAGHDMLVLGDSFSVGGVWQAYLRARSGYSSLTLDVNATDLERVLGTDAYRAAPPKLVVLQAVELFMLDRFARMDRPCAIGGERSAVRTAPWPAPGAMQLPQIERPRSSSLGNLNLKYALLYLQREFQRTMFGADGSLVLRYRLARADLFSNRRSDEILVYAPDLAKLDWPRERLRAGACHIRALQDRVESDGTTAFVFLLVPDKSTAYAEFLLGAPFQPVPAAVQALVAAGVHLAPLDGLLRRAIHAGERDVYLPNDTHFGARGFELAAQAVAAQLSARATGADRKR